MLRGLVSCCLAASLVCGHVSDARAEPRPLSQLRSRRYYYLHSGIMFGAVAAVAIEDLATVHHGAGFDLDSFGPDDAVRGSFSDAAARLSDKLLVVTLTAPLFLQMSEGFGTSMANVSVIYGEAQALNLLAHKTAQIIVRRPRPYTHSKDPRILEFTDREGSEAYASFYSGHASTAFTSATAGSILYAARTNELVARHAVWGLEFMLAGITAQLRVRSGRHYRTDVWVGTLAGLATGVLVPALHGVDLGRVRGTELATAGGAFALTMGLSEVVDFCSILDTLHLCNLPRDIAMPLADARLDSPSWVVLPAPVAGGIGLSLAGEL